MTEGVDRRPQALPGGVLTVASWENALLHDAMELPYAAGNPLHPVALLLAPLRDAGLASAAASRGGDSASRDALALTAFACDITETLHEDRTYFFNAAVAASPGRASADVSICEGADTEPIGKVRATWSVHSKPSDRPARGTGITLPEWRVDVITAEKIKLLVALARHADPLQIDRVAARRATGRPRLVAPRSLGAGHVINMLMAWAGNDRLRRLDLRFHADVCEGDTIKSSGWARRATSGTTCDVWLTRTDGTIAVSGTATVDAL